MWDLFLCPLSCVEFNDSCCSSFNFICEVTAVKLIKSCVYVYHWNSGTSCSEEYWCRGTAYSCMYRFYAAKMTIIWDVHHSFHLGFWHTLGILWILHMCVCAHVCVSDPSILSAKLPDEACRLFNLRILIFAKHIVWIDASLLHRAFALWWKGHCSTYFVPSPYWCVIQMAFPVTLVYFQEDVLVNQNSERGESCISDSFEIGFLFQCWIIMYSLSCLGYIWSL
jgi:hypothetical protein